MARARSTEGNTYEANWRKAREGYVAWLKRRPRQQVKGATEDELVEELWEIAMEAYGDGEACFDFVPPLPAPSASTNYFDPPWFTLSCNEGFHRVGDSTALYRDGLCSFCRAGLGGRTGVERVVTGSLKGDLGFVWGALPSAWIVSDAFIDFFRPIFGTAMRVHPCRSERRSRKRMWELELEATVPLVCHKKATHNNGVVCPKCRTARYGGFVYEPIQKYLGTAVSRSAIDGLATPAVIAGAGDRAEILVNEALSLAVKRSLKGILLKRIALLAANETGPFKIVKLKKSDVGG